MLYLYRSLWLWLWLRVTRSAESRFCWLHNFLVLFSIDEEKIWCGRIYSSWTSWYYFLVTFMWWLHQKTWKKSSNGMHAHIYKLIWFKLGIWTDTCKRHVDSCLSDLTSIQDQKGAKKQTFLCQMPHKVHVQFSWNLKCCEICGQMNLRSVASCVVSVQGREPCVGDLIETNFSIGLLSTFTGWFLSNSVWC